MFFGRFFFIFAGLVASFAMWGGPALSAVDVASLESAWQRVWRLGQKMSGKWSDYEIRQWTGAHGSVPVPPRLEWSEDRHQVTVSFWDGVSRHGIGKIRIHLIEPPPLNQYHFLESADILEDPRQITLNGVRFYRRGREDGILREVYLGDVSGGSELEDRLRLSVNDNEILNPWLRYYVAPLRREWGDPEMRTASPPQQEAVHFLSDLWQRDELKKGALVQMPTGMGKTEVALFFLHELLKKNQKFRVLWLVRGIDLVEQAKARFESFFTPANGGAHLSDPGDVASWHSFLPKEERKKRELIPHGGIPHLFVSMDSLAPSDAIPARNEITRWFYHDESPVIVIVDESHSLKAPIYQGLYDWLWEHFTDRTKGSHSFCTC